MRVGEKSRNLRLQKKGRAKDVHEAVLMTSHWRHGDLTI